MKFKGKHRNKPKTRKDLRKEKRLQKKKNRFNYHNIKKNKNSSSKSEINEKATQLAEFSEDDEEILSSEDEQTEKQQQDDEDKLQKFLKREKKEHDEYFQEIKRNRVDQLRQANEEEDKIIAKYEKLLKLNRRGKRNGKKEEEGSIGKFNDGLDYLLELCTDDGIEKMYEAAKEAFSDVSKKRKTRARNDSKSDDDENQIEKSEKLKAMEEKYFGDDQDFFNALDQENISSLSSNEDDNQSDTTENSSSINENEDYENCDDEKLLQEDIYGRKRDMQGNVIQETSKYIPPQMRRKIDGDDAPVRNSQLASLRRQVKGHINRLTESNLHKIIIDLEHIYSSNSRNDTNTILCEVLLDSLISNVIAKERTVLEHTLLIAALNANVGCEVGSFILQSLIERFDKLYQNIDEKIDVEDKELDNVIYVISHLFTFKLFKHHLIYDILNKLSNKLNEKRIDCILLVLRSIGFLLRKEDPQLLKEFITTTQKILHNIQEEDKNSRVAFMFDTLMAIKNNNMTKIPQYDPALVDHFRKLLKQYIRPGSYTATLAVSMDDLLNIEKRGKWWLVGSAWTGTSTTKTNHLLDTTSIIGNNDDQRSKIYALAKKQRMNTDAKRNIFYLLMTAEDYIDAFDKIISSTNDQRTIISVLLHCCLSEKSFNRFYAVLAQQFCDHSRKFVMAVQYAIWDRIKELKTLSSHQISNLAHFLAHLIENNNVALSVLKVIEFGQLEKTTSLFMRKVMLILLSSDESKLDKIFGKLSTSVKLSSFKDHLRIFLKVFLLTDETSKKMSSEQIDIIRARLKIVEKYLST